MGQTIYALVQIAPGKRVDELLGIISHNGNPRNDLMTKHNLGGTEQDRQNFWNSLGDKWLQPMYAMLDGDIITTVFLGKYRIEQIKSDLPFSVTDMYNIIDCDNNSTFSTEPYKDVHIILNALNMSDLTYMVDLYEFTQEVNLRMIKFPKYG